MILDCQVREETPPQRPQVEKALCPPPPNSLVVLLRPRPILPRVEPAITSTLKLASLVMPLVLRAVAPTTHSIPPQGVAPVVNSMRLGTSVL